jgi:hypothetical protein
MVLKSYKNVLKDLWFFFVFFYLFFYFFFIRGIFLFLGLVLGVSPERFSRMPHGATCHWDDHRMPGHAPWDATCHWGLLSGWNVAVSALA